MDLYEFGNTKACVAIYYAFEKEDDTRFKHFIRTRIVNAFRYARKLENISDPEFRNYLLELIINQYKKLHEDQRNAVTENKKYIRSLMNNIIMTRFKQIRKIKDN